jgi:hypothetical protein
VYEIPEDNTDVPKHVGLVKDHILLSYVHFSGFINGYFNIVKLIG